MWCVLPSAGSEAWGAAGTPTVMGAARAGTGPSLATLLDASRVLPSAGSDPPAAEGTPALGTAAATRVSGLVGSAVIAGAPPGAEAPGMTGAGAGSSAGATALAEAGSEEAAATGAAATPVVDADDSGA